jgi:hypothetical protein
VFVRHICSIKVCVCVVAGATGAKKSVEQGDTFNCRSCCRDTQKATWRDLARLGATWRALLTRYTYILSSSAKHTYSAHALNIHTLLTR